MAMSRSDWIAIAAVFVAAAVGIPQILSFLRINPPVKPDVKITLLNLKYELGHSETKPDKQFFLITRIKLRVLNDSDKTTDIRVNPYAATINNGTVYDPDNTESQSVESNKTSEFSLEIQDNYDYVTNQGYNRIFDANNGDVEGILKSKSLNLLNNRYLVYGYKNTVICNNETKPLYEEAFKRRMSYKLLIVHYGEASLKYCAVGIGTETSNEYW